MTQTYNAMVISMECLQGDTYLISYIDEI